MTNGTLSTLPTGAMSRSTRGQMQKLSTGELHSVLPRGVPLGQSIVVWGETGDAAKARAALAGDEIKDAMKEAGVVGPPKIHVVAFAWRSPGWRVHAERESLVRARGSSQNMRPDRPYRSGRSPDWIKVKNPDVPAATRVIE
jgi:hypothetical protein